MKITLRKANALQQNIQDAIRQIDVVVKVDLNEFEDPETLLIRANEQLIKNDKRRFELTQALYDIRTLIGQANDQVGINVRLSKAAFIDKRISQLSNLILPVALQESQVVITGKLQKLKDQDNRSYGFGSNSVTTGVLTQDQIDNFKSHQLSLKKDKQKLNDEILELNVRTEISLSNEIEEILLVENLL